MQVRNDGLEGAGFPSGRGERHEPAKATRPAAVKLMASMWAVPAGVAGVMAVMALLRGNLEPTLLRGNLGHAVWFLTFALVCSAIAVGAWLMWRWVWWVTLTLIPVVLLLALAVSPVGIVWLGPVILLLPGLAVVVSPSCRQAFGIRPRSEGPSPPRGIVMDGWQIVPLIGLAVALVVLGWFLAQNTSLSRDTFVGYWVRSGLALEATIVFLALLVLRAWPRRPSVLAWMALLSAAGVGVISWGVAATFGPEMPSSAGVLIPAGLVLLTGITFMVMVWVYALQPSHPAVAVATVGIYVLLLVSPALPQLGGSPSNSTHSTLPPPVPSATSEAMVVAEFLRSEGLDLPWQDIAVGPDDPFTSAASARYEPAGAQPAPFVGLGWIGVFPTVNQARSAAEQRAVDMSRSLQSTGAGTWSNWMWCGRIGVAFAAGFQQPESSDAAKLWVDTTMDSTWRLLGLAGSPCGMFERGP